MSEIKKICVLLRKRSKIVVQELLRLDSSPPQFLNEQADRWTDKRQVEIAIQIGEHSYMPNYCLYTKISVVACRRAKRNGKNYCVLIPPPLSFLMDQKAQFD